MERSTVPVVVLFLALMGFAFGLAWAIMQLWIHVAAVLGPALYWPGH